MDIKLGELVFSFSLENGNNVLLISFGMLILCYLQAKRYEVGQDVKCVPYFHRSIGF